MGRDVTGLHVSSLKEKPNIVSKTSMKVFEAKLSVKKGVTEAAENLKGKHDVLGVKTPNLVDGKNDANNNNNNPVYPTIKQGLRKNDAKSSKIEETKLNSGVIETSTAKNLNGKHAKSSKIEAPNLLKLKHALGVKAPYLEVGKKDAKSSKIEETKLSSPNESGDQHGYVSPVTTENPGLCSNTSPKINVQPSPTPSKKSQSNSPFLTRKHLDDDDNCSTGSSTTALGRTARFKTTVPVAPKFCVTDRLEKRKEFYTKLEEKHMALEAEKREYEARSKEEEQAAIKQMRKAMVYKANPVPNFYYEGPPPKKDLKKLPTTRAVSPKFGCRKSCGDAVTSSVEEKAVIPSATRHSLGGYNPKQASVTLNSTPKKKGPVHQPNGKGSLKKKHPKLPVKEPVSFPPPPPPEHNRADKQRHRADKHRHLGSIVNF